MSKRTAGYGMFIALSFLFSYIETWIPFSFGIPGAKLGLANLVTLTALYVMGPWDAFWISLVRVLLTGFTFGNLSMLFYSLGGGLLSFWVMCFCKQRIRLGKTGVSVAGGISHNLGQLLVAAAAVQNTNLLYYFPILLLFGTLSGAVIGMLGALVIRRIPGQAGYTTSSTKAAGYEKTEAEVGRGGPVPIEGEQEVLRKKNRDFLEKKDLVFLGICFFAGFGILAVSRIFTDGSSEKQAVVYVGDEEYGRVGLDQELTLEIPGEGGGTNLLVIQEGKAFVTWASCPDKICVGQGEVSQIGEAIVCMPNQVIVAVEAARE